MGTECVPRRMPRLNSDTNLAVQLLLAVSDVRTTQPSSTTSSDMPVDTSDDSDATEIPTSYPSPNIEKNKSLPVVASPKSIPALPRPDTTFFKYTHTERQEALQRFRDKKRRRQFRKRVRYMVRKRLAETRPRYKGRFSKPPPGENYDDGTPGPPAEKTHSNHNNIHDDRADGKNPG